MNSGRLFSLALCGLALVTAAAVPSSAQQPDDLRVSAPASVVAGDAVRIEVSGDDGPATVVISQGIRFDVAAVVINDGRAVVDLDPALTRLAGLTTVTARQGQQEASTEVTIEAGPAVSPILLTVGGRSIVADGADRSMAIAIAADQFSNPLADGAVTSLRFRRPDGSIETATVRNSTLLGWHRISAGTLAGTTSVVATHGAAASATVDLRETAGAPVAFDLVVSAATELEGRGDRVVRTSRVVDAFDNVLPDGTAAVFTTSGPGGTGRAVVKLVDGVAELRMPVPNQPGVVAVRARIGSTEATANVSFDRSVQDLPVAARATGIGTVSITVGPVFDGLGGFVTDGTEAVVLVGDDVVGRASLLDGMATVEAVTQATEVTVIVRGVRATAEVES